MKPIQLLILAFITGIFLYSCEPVEDSFLRDKYITNADAPITKEKLQQALSVTQPFENQDGKVQGDQYVVLKNSRPDIGGAWHLEWGTGEKILGTDNDTVVYQSNGDYQIYYVGISGNEIIQTDPVTITVTNVFDDWSTHFTGAADKADQQAQKTWTLREVSWGSVCNMGAHGGWKYVDAGYVPESNFAWWASVSLADAGHQTMVFKFDASKMLVYDAAGNLKSEGNFSFNHNSPEDGVLGELVTTVPTIAGSYDECGQTNGNNTFWILTLTDEYITIYHPAVYSGGVDWTDYGWYAYFEAE